MSNIASKKREYEFDNLKALLIILVVFGHISEYLHLKGVFLNINCVLYVFHMPLFIFISGYFSKNSSKLEEKTVKNMLIPFFIFNTIYIFMDEKIVDKNILTPVYAYWYLLSLFFWRLFVKAINKFKIPVILLLLASLYIGIIEEPNRFLSISRTIAFFPYYILGYNMDEVHIEKIKGISKKITIPILIILFVIVFNLPNLEDKIELFKCAQSFQKTGVSKFEGIKVRIFQFVISMLISICLINLIPKNKNWMSNIGRKTITIYVLSPFIQFGLTKLIEENCVYIIGENVETVLICVISTILIVWICSRDIVFNTYNKIINFIYRQVTTKDDSILGKYLQN